jgi:hypothetical protein
MPWTRNGKARSGIESRAGAGSSYGQQGQKGRSVVKTKGSRDGEKNQKDSAFNERQKEAGD